MMLSAAAASSAVTAGAVGAESVVTAGAVGTEDEAEAGSAEVFSSTEVPTGNTSSAVAGVVGGALLEEAEASESSGDFELILLVGLAADLASALALALASILALVNSFFWIALAVACSAASRHLPFTRVCGRGDEGSLHLSHDQCAIEEG